VSKVRWRENRTSPPRAASPVCSEACQPIWLVDWQWKILGIG
jgi:hypothetical protein